MIPYFLLLIISFMFYFVYTKEIAGNRCNYYIGFNKNNNETNLTLPIFFIALCLMLIFRAETVGRDIANYKYIFESYKNNNLATVFSKWGEVLFGLLNYVICALTGNYRVFLIVTSIIEVLPIGIVYCKDKSHSFIKLALFINMSTFVMMFSGIRQALAISIGVLAFDCASRKKLLPFIIWALISTFIHLSGFMVFLIYPICKLRLKKNQLWLIALIMLVLIVFNQQIFMALSNIFSLIYDKAEIETSYTGAWGSFILFLILMVFVYFVADESQMDYQAFALRNILTFAVLMQCFAPLHNLAMRMNYYFIILIPLAVGYCLKFPRLKYKNIANLGEKIIIVFFIFYFVYSIYLSYKSGSGLLDIVPYVPFWK